MWEHVTTHIQAAEKFLDTPEIPWKSLITSLLWIVYLFETYVSWRQYRLYSLTTPPKALMAHVSHEDFVKSQRYNSFLQENYLQEFLLRCRGLRIWHCLCSSSGGC